MNKQEKLVLKAKQELWKRHLAHQVFLDSNQKLWRERFVNSPPFSSFVWLVSRQVGKSWAAVFLAIEQCVYKPGSVVQFCSKTKDSAHKIVMPAWEALTTTLPKSMKPKKGRTEYEFVFPNGSVFRIFGTDSQSFSKGRGPKSDFIILDEVGFMANLEQIESALLPTTLTTGGKVLYISTPPESIAHPYVERIRSHKETGNFEYATIYDATRIDVDQFLKSEAKRRGKHSVQELIDSTYFRREFLCEIVQEESTAGFPGFNNTHKCIQEFNLPKYFDGYVASDTGVSTDPHAGLIGIYNWHDGKIYIVDEVQKPSGITSIGSFVDSLREKEDVYFGKDKRSGVPVSSIEIKTTLNGLPDYFKEEFLGRQPKQPLLRVSDNSGGTAKAMTLDYNYLTFPALKVDKKINVDLTNTALNELEIIIHPRCKNLLHQLESAQWNTEKSKWKPSIGVNGEHNHCDLVDCLVYLKRAVIKNRTRLLPNPVKEEWKRLVPEMFEQKNGLESLAGGVFERNKTKGRKLY